MRGKLSALMRSRVSFALSDSERPKSIARRLSNPVKGSVRASLSRTQLTLCYTPGRFGTATITVGATDADGVSVRETVLVTVLPVGKSAGARGV